MSEQILTRLAETSGSIGEARTVEVIWSTGVKVKRYDWDKDGWYMEELSMEPKAIRLDRFRSGMSLLDTHDGYSMSSRLGAVVKDSVRIEGGKAYATVKFSRNQLGEQIFQDLKDGIPVQISVGYRVHKYEKTTGEEGQMPTYRAIDWEPMELSAVPIPADAGAHSRSASIPPEEAMDDDNTETETETRHHPNNVIRERTRAKQIRQLAERTRSRIADVDDLAARALDGGTTVEAFRAAVLDKLVEQQSRTPTFPHVEIGGMDDNQTRVAAMADALLTRVDPSHKPKDDARQFVGLSVVEIARECLGGQGIHAARGLSPHEVISRAVHGKGDFPQVITEIGQTFLKARYAASRPALQRVASKNILPDFRAVKVVELSEFPDLLPVTEFGEHKAATYTEGPVESMRVYSFSRTFGMSFEMMVNDNLGAFLRIEKDMLAAAFRKEAEVLAAALNSNPIMGDGNPVFCAEHHNLLESGSTIMAAQLSDMRKMMRKQTGLAGELVDISPKYIVVGPEMETAAEMVLAAINPGTTADVNVFSQKLELVVERRITDKSWYLVADPMECSCLQYAQLMGCEYPELMHRLGFEYDGMEFRVTHRFGAGWYDWRGWVKNSDPATTATIALNNPDDPADPDEGAGF